MARLKESNESLDQKLEDLQTIKRCMEYCKPLLVWENARLKEETPRRLSSYDYCKTCIMLVICCLVPDHLMMFATC
jgi:Pyruvate/2-oxoacid:ferredoxin oxidoreductase delta subunit